MSIESSSSWILDAPSVDVLGQQCGLWWGALPQPDARTLTVFLNEDHAGGFECGTDCGASVVRNLAAASLEVYHRRQAETGGRGKGRLCHFNERAGGSALCGRHDQHFLLMIIDPETINIFC